MRLSTYCKKILKMNTSSIHFDSPLPDCKSPGEVKSCFITWQILKFRKMMFRGWYYVNHGCVPSTFFSFHFSCSGLGTCRYFIAMGGLLKCTKDQLTFQLKHAKIEYYKSPQNTSDFHYWWEEVQSNPMASNWI